VTKPAELVVMAELAELAVTATSVARSVVVELAAEVERDAWWPDESCCARRCFGSCGGLRVQPPT